MEAEVRLDNETPTTTESSKSSETADQSSGAATLFTSNESIYQAISIYPFETDSEFQAGLSSILGHPDVPATPQELSDKPGLVVKAQSFYFCRKFNIPRIDPNAYKAWKEGQDSTTSISTSTVAEAPTQSRSDAIPDSATEPSVATTAPPARAEPPPYPTSFAAIVELITNNKPIPGIEEIPDTVLDLGSSKRDRVTRRRKPWEKEDTITADSTTVSGTEPPFTATAAPTTTDTTTDTPLSTLTAALASSLPAVDPTNDTAEADSTEIKSDSRPKERKLHHMRLDGRGAVHLLKPDAVEDSGLIAKD